MNTNTKQFLAIHTILLPRENIFYIEEWLKYYFLLGIDHIYLYDNTGSVGRNGSTITTNKYGFNFYEKTKHLSDEDIDIKFKKCISHFKNNFLALKVKLEL